MSEWYLEKERYPGSGTLIFSPDTWEFERHDRYAPYCTCSFCREMRVGAAEANARRAKLEKQEAESAAKTACWVLANMLRGPAVELQREIAAGAQALWNFLEGVGLAVAEYNRRYEESYAHRPLELY